MHRVHSITQYACAVLLIVSSIFMVAYQVFTIADVANGLLMYVAQAFLLAGSIFGLDYYVKQIKEWSPSRPPQGEENGKTQEV